MMDWTEFELQAKVEIREDMLFCHLDAKKPWPTGTQFAYYLFCNNTRISTKWYTNEDYASFPLGESGAYQIVFFLRIGEEAPLILKSRIVAYFSSADGCSRPMRKLSIFGSCVSRDLLEYPENRFLSLGAYIGRQSVVSAVSKPLSCQLESIALSSSFQRRQVYHDLVKDTFKVLEGSKADYLMIDLIDERFNLGILDGSIVTLSNEMTVSTYRAEEIQTVPRIYDRTSKDYMINGTSLRGHMDAFVERLLDLYLPEQIILHKAFFVNSYITKEGERENFGISQRSWNKRNNHLLHFMHDYLQTCLPQAHVIDLCENFHADAKHKWGLSPMHYQEGYYRVALAAVKRILEKKEDSAGEQAGKDSR